MSDATDEALRGYPIQLDAQRLRSGRPLRIYIAGASKEMDLISSYMRKVESLGHTISLDWTVPIRENIALGKTDADLTKEDRKRHANADMFAVGDADLVWLLVPAEPKSSLGCWIEFGLAVAFGCHVIVSGPNASIFCELADHLFATHDEALEWLRSQK